MNYKYKKNKKKLKKKKKQSYTLNKKSSHVLSY